MKLRIFGPNLSHAGQVKGDFHVHAADCADCTFYGPGRKYGGDTDYEKSVDLDSEKAVVTYIYPPDCFEYDADTEWTGFAADIYLAPCVKFE